MEGQCVSGSLLGCLHKRHVTHFHGWKNKSEGCEWPFAQRESSRYWRDLLSSSRDCTADKAGQHDVMRAKQVTALTEACASSVASVTMMRERMAGWVTTHKAC